MIRIIGVLLLPLALLWAIGRVVMNLFKGKKVNQTFTPLDDITTGTKDLKRDRVQGDTLGDRDYAIIAEQEQQQQTIELHENDIQFLFFLPQTPYELKAHTAFGRLFYFTSKIWLTFFNKGCTTFCKIISYKWCRTFP